MKKFMAFSLVLALCTGLFCGCGSQKTVDESTVYVQKNGKITAVDVEAFDENSYSFDELQAFCVLWHNDLYFLLPFINSKKYRRFLL